MDSAWVILLFVFVLFAALLGALELGTRTGRRLLAHDPESPKGTTAADGLVFALLGLLIAFTFSGAASRFDHRRDQIVAEANALGTAWMRLDLLPEAQQDEVRARFLGYFDARLAVYAAMPEKASVQAALAVVQERQNELWRAASAACSGAELARAVPVLPPLNQAFDLSSERTEARRRHPPTAIYLLLVVLSLGGAFLAGQAMAIAKTNLLRNRLLFAGLLAFTVFTIFDLEYPRVGLVRLDEFDSVLIDLRASLG